MPLQIIPTSFVYTVVPLLVKNLVGNKEKNDKIVTLSFKILVFVSTFIAIVFSFKKTQLTPLILSNKYYESAFPLELLLWCQVFIFINYFALDLFMVYNKQIWNFYFSVLVVIINLVANLLLIPIFSYNGPAIAKLIAGMAGFIMVVFFFLKLPLKIDFRFKDLIILLTTSVSLVYLSSFMPLFLYMPAVIVIFVLTLLVTRFFSFNEIEFILSMFNMPELSKKINKYYH
jgi:O-antigen/teichoic acid export membrane protein